MRTTNQPKKVQNLSSLPNLPSTEILEYAKFLGMDLQKDRDLFYIAKEGLKAPLPEPWKPCQTRDGEIYYFNFETGDSTWDHPCDEYYKKMYEREKQKKNERLMQSQAQKMRGSGFTEDTRGPLAGPGLGSLKFRFILWIFYWQARKSREKRL